MLVISPALEFPWPIKSLYKTLDNSSLNLSIFFPTLNPKQLILHEGGGSLSEDLGPYIILKALGLGFRVLNPKSYFSCSFPMIPNITPMR